MTLAVERFRAAVACLLLTALVFAQEAGRVVPDTKLDLVVDPVGLLARSLHLWDPQGGAGQLQNQAYGYLFPMGPLFAGLQAAGLPDWAVQRVWQSLVLCAALLGVRALAGRLGIGTPATRLLAGVAYALAARPVSQLGAISVEVWPYALAPWVLVPLVTAARHGSVRRGAALSGVAVLLVGGVNAAATLAVVPLGALWIAVQPPGPRRRRLAAWWAVALAGATAWWLVPLVVLGRWSPPFLDVIESARTTTGQTGLWSVLTGNDLWLQYLAIAGPARPAGYLLVTEAGLVVCVTALTALGLAGLLLREVPHRGFLVGGVLLGLLVVGAGHVGPVARPFAGLERDLLDGALAAFRNVHKYDLLLRLPLALGLAHAASVVRLPRTRWPGLRPVAALAGIALVGAASPAVGSLQPPGSFEQVPPYWQEVADFLEDAEPGRAPARALLVPAASFGEYAWGSPRDEPLQALARTPWAVRDAVPLGGPGATRALDVVEEALRTGRGSPALAAYLARAGVRHLVVRNDLDANATGATRPLVVHAALAASPGLTRVASFGPPVGAGFGTGPVVADAQLAPTYPAVEVFEVAGPVEAVTTWPRPGTQRVSGGPESVLPLLESGALDPSGAVRLAGEPPLPGDGAELRTLTDGYRDRERDFGRATDQASATLGGGQPPRLDREVRDYLPVADPRSRTTAVLHGVRDVRASSSAADADALLVRSREHHAAAAFDGDPATAWVTGGFSPAGQWVEARFAPTRLAAVELGTPALLAAGLRPDRARVTTDEGDVDVVLAGGATRVPLDVRTSRLRVTLTGFDGPAEVGTAALEAELVPADGGRLRAERGLRLPDDGARSTGGRPAATPVTVVLTTGRGARPGCLPVGDRPVCAAALPESDEDSDAVDRAFTVDAPALYGVAVTARARPGTATDALLQRGQPISVTATSSAVPDAAGGPTAVLDRDARTGWTASTLDPAPALTVALARPQRVDGVRVVLDQNLAASRPTTVSVRVDGGPEEEVRLSGTGVGRLAAAVTGRRVEVAFPEVQRRASVRRDGSLEGLPVGVTELQLLGGPVDRLRLTGDPSARVELPCGEGPALEVDGAVRQATRVVATRGALRDGGPVQVEPCGGPLELTAGEHRVRLARTAAVQVDGLVLTDLARPAPASGSSRVQRVQEWGSGRRALQVSSGVPSWLVVHEAFNAGWTARLDGRPLTAARLDGWQQGFALPSGGGRVVLEFAPDAAYRTGLVAGGVLAVALLVLAALPVRRTGPPVAARGRRRPGPVLAALALPLLAGWAGLAALAVAAVVAVALRRALLPLAVAALLGAGALVAARPWPDRTLLEAPVQLLCLAAVAALAVSLLAPPRGRRAAGRGRAPSAAAPAPPPASATPTPPAG